MSNLCDIIGKNTPANKCFSVVYNDIIIVDNQPFNYVEGLPFIYESEPNEYGDLVVESEDLHVFEDVLVCWGSLDDSYFYTEVWDFCLDLYNYYVSVNGKNMPSLYEILEYPYLSDYDNQKPWLMDELTNLIHISKTCNVRADIEKLAYLIDRYTKIHTWYISAGGN